MSPSGRGRKPVRAALRTVRLARADHLRPALDALVASADRVAALAHDPLGLVHRYRRAEDREVVGLLASAVAYGRVDLFRPRLAALLDALGPEPARLARNASPGELLQRCAAFHYRMTGPAEVAALLAGAGEVQRKYKLIGHFVEGAFERFGGDLRTALASFVEALWTVDLRPFTGERAPTRRLAHLVASPALASACKRLNLYVRWMTRGPDEVDFGLWRLPTSALLMPLDTHVHRISRLLGLTQRTDLSWRTAEEITRALRLLDPDDPVKYDFALSHLGISGRCTSRRTGACSACPLRPLCRVWAPGVRGRSGPLNSA